MDTIGSAALVTVSDKSGVSLSISVSFVVKSQPVLSAQLLTNTNSLLKSSCRLGCFGLPQVNYISALPGGQDAEVDARVVKVCDHFTIRTT